jgi:hypothetical protein
MPSAPVDASKELDGDGRPFSLFFPDPDTASNGLEGAAASLLGAGVNWLPDSFAFKTGFGVAPCLEKKPRMLLWPWEDLFLDWEEEDDDFFKVGFGVATSLPSIPRAIGAVVGRDDWAMKRWNWL